MTTCRTARSRMVAGLLGCAALCLVAQALWAQLAGPTAYEQKIAQAVAQKLEEYHLTHHKLDGEIAQRLFRTFLKELDPTKVYFDASDIDEFQQHEPELFKKPRNRNSEPEIDLAFAHMVLERFLTRVRERLSLVEELVNAPFDFTEDEYLNTDYDKLDYARTPEEMRERWRKKIKFDLLVQRLDKKPLPAAEQREKILKRYRNLLHRMEQTDANELLEMYLNALSTSFDPHSNYMAPSTLEDFNISMRLSLEGIGARLSSEDGYTIVKEVLPGGAADKDGRLKVEDKIIGVAADGDKLEDVVDMKLIDVVKRIRGPRGTPVVLRVIPAGNTEPAEYRLMRAKIELKEQEAQSVVVETGKKEDGTPYRIGFIKLPSFYMDVAAANSRRSNYKSSTRDVLNKLKEFQDEGPIDGIILDLRNNGGGALKEAINLTGLFIDRGAIVQVKGADGRVEPMDDDEPGTAYAGPLMVLVSKLSASASEIFAGAIQDYGRGLIVGDSSTHGKGTVQTMIEIAEQAGLARRGSPQLGALKLTIQQFYRVNGDSTQNRGVASDIVLPSLVDHFEIGESHLPQAMPFGHVEPVQHASAGLVTPELKAQLQTLSDKRRQDSTEFRKLADDIARLETINRRKSIALNEEKRREEIKSGANEEDVIPDPDQPKKKDETVFPRDFYDNEVLAIMQDFLRLGNHPHVAANL